MNEPLHAEVEEIRALQLKGRIDEAATAVVRAHGERILNYLRAVLRDEDEAGDAFSLWAEWTWTAMRTFRGASSVRTWTYGVAWNAARRVRDDSWKHHRATFHSEAAARLAKAIRTTSVARTQRAADAFEALRRELDPDEQNLLALRVDQGLEWEEVAEALAQAGEEVSVAALRKRFERLKDRIADRARREGLLR